MEMDICARWQTKENHISYLRESGHRQCYATQHLFKEAFDDDDGNAEIPAEVLRERLAHTLTLVEERERYVNMETDPKEIEEVKQSFRDFVELCETKEKETGEPVTISASY